MRLGLGRHQGRRTSGIRFRARRFNRKQQVSAVGAGASDVAPPRVRLELAIGDALPEPDEGLGVRHAAEVADRGVHPAFVPLLEDRVRPLLRARHRRRVDASAVGSRRVRGNEAGSGQRLWALSSARPGGVCGQGGPLRPKCTADGVRSPPRSCRGDKTGGLAGGPTVSRCVTLIRSGGPTRRHVAHPAKHGQHALARPVAETRARATQGARPRLWSSRGRLARRQKASGRARTARREPAQERVAVGRPARGGQHTRAPGGPKRADGAPSAPRRNAIVPADGSLKEGVCLVSWNITRSSISTKSATIVDSSRR